MCIVIHRVTSVFHLAMAINILVTITVVVLLEKFRIIRAMVTSSDIWHSFELFMVLIRDFSDLDLFKHSQFIHNVRSLSVCCVDVDSGVAEYHPVLK